MVENTNTVSSEVEATNKRDGMDLWLGLGGSLVANYLVIVLVQVIRDNGYPLQNDQLGTTMFWTLITSVLLLNASAIFLALVLHRPRIAKGMAISYAIGLGIAICQIVPLSLGLLLMIWAMGHP